MFFTETEVIPVKVAPPTKDPASFLEKIELVPLETNETLFAFSILDAQ